MRVSRAASIEDLRLCAKRRLPRFAFDFFDGGAEDENNLKSNREDLEAIELCPRYLVDVANLTTETELFGKSYSVPFGIAPVGFLNLAWPGTDIALAKLAAERRFPMVISTASSTALEHVASAAQGYAWFQLYVPGDVEMCDQLINRAAAAGIDTLIVTVDVPKAGKRDRDIRNGLQIPFKLTPEIIAQLVAHPRWSLETLKAGVPGFGNFNTGNKAMSVVEVQHHIISPSFTWEGLRALRKKWSGTLLLKGILHPEDAKMAVAAGCDGIIVSNHGGRQTDHGPSSIKGLPAIVKASAGKVPILFDSGIRRGADFIRAKALGASFIFAGRAFAFGAAAGGAAGCERAFDILELELTRALGQIGCPEFSKIDHKLLRRRLGSVTSSGHG
jgi:(S)-mandelate dehydrogenase